MRRWAAGLVLVPVLVYVLAAVALDTSGQATPVLTRIDAIVVAGAGVDPEGTAGPSLWARTRRAVDLYDAGVAPTLAFTGGVGDWPPSEAEVARRLAVSWGVPDAVLVLEDRSTSTEENAANLASILGPDAHIVVVTDAYHVFRVRRVFGRYFHDVEGVGVRSPVGVRVPGALREVGAVVWYALTGRMAAASPSSPG